MKHCMRNLFLMGCVFFITLGCTVLQEGRADDHPVIYFKEPTFAFAPLLEGVEIKHDFIFENKGAKELKILTVRTG